MSKFARRFYAAKNVSVSKHGVYKLGFLDVDLYEDLYKTSYIELHPIRCPVLKVHPDPVPGSKYSYRPDARRKKEIPIPMVLCGSLSAKCRCMSKIVPLFILQKMRPFQNMDVLKDALQTAAHQMKHQMRRGRGHTRGRA